MLVIFEDMVVVSFVKSFHQEAASSIRRSFELGNPLNRLHEKNTARNLHLTRDAVAQTLTR